jgi:hypothetical protein
MADRHLRIEAGDRADVASYVAALSGDLAVLARRAGLETIGYLLDMAKLEAEQASGHEQESGH